MQACWADTAARDYADQQGREVERDLAVEALAAELMAPGAEYDPLNARNFDEALCESMVARDSTLSAQMAELLRAGKDTEFVAMVRKTAHSYMKRLAMIEAETRIDELDEEYEEF